MRSRRIPIACSRHRDCRATVHTGRDEHSLVAGKHGLAHCHDAPTIVDCFDVADAFHTIVLIRERFCDLAILVTICSSIHGFWVDVCGSWLPLVHELSWRAGVRAVRACDALLIWAQSPPGVQFAWSNGHQTCVLREFTLSRPVDQLSPLDQVQILSVSVVSGMPLVQVAMA